MKQINIKNRPFKCPILGEVSNDYTYCCSKCKYSIFSTPIDNIVYCEYEEY